MISKETKDAILREAEKHPQKRAAMLFALHAVQKEKGWIESDSVREIASLLDVREIEVVECVSFYTMFNRRPVGKYHLQVCTNLSCCLTGARPVINRIRSELRIGVGETTQDKLFSLSEVECLGSCGTAPMMQVNDDYYEQLDEKRVADIIAALRSGKKPPPFIVSPQAETPPDVPHEIYLSKNFRNRDSHTIGAYLGAGGYEAAKKALKEITPDEVTDAVKQSGLRGRGGAGFPTGVKWGFMPKETSMPMYIGCNGDESEPGTFKDRQLMERDPHMVLEGLIIGGYAMRVSTVYIYVRGEYARQAERLQAAIDEAYKKKLLGKGIFGTSYGLDIHVTRGGGAYICGEETGMMESIEGKKGQPRKKPPFPAAYGLWGRPTTINNFETFAHIPHVIAEGANWFKAVGTEKSTGNTLFGVSGHVKKPGVFELPLGTPIGKVIFDYGGGMQDDRPLKAVIPGGSSTKVLPASMIDVGLDHESLAKAGSALGTAAVIVMDSTTCMVRVGQVLSHFYRHESCGQCTPCREGSAWVHEIISRIERGDGNSRDLDLLDDVCSNMEGTTICMLSDAAAWAVQGLLNHFRGEFEEHIRQAKCPYPESFEV